jgi:hypothetical protein
MPNNNAAKLMYFSPSSVYEALLRNDKRVANYESYM